MLKILGRNNSSNVQKVLWCCGELGIPFEREDYGREFGRNREPEYLAMNPNGLVPTIVDDGFVLWESNTICRYLAARYDRAGKLYAEDPQARANAERWMDWQLSVNQPAFGPLFHLFARTPADQRDPKAVAEGVERAAKTFAIMDAQLGKSRFLAGDSLSLADIPLGINVYRWFAFDIEKRPAFDNLKRWYDSLTQRPAYQEHVMIGL
jgi:glutathione S-transferase